MTMDDFKWTPLKYTFPVMISFGDYHEIEEMEKFFSFLFNRKFESFELGEEDIENYKERTVKLVKRSGDFYVGLFQPSYPPEMHYNTPREEVIFR
tara:strand:+ start:588 stop:872 length:285 start_codon:yes stop_codon:yes gene_type:complete